MENQNKGTGALICSVLGCVLAFISIFVCGWLGFVGAVLGFIGLVASQGEPPAVICGIIAIIGGLIFGIIWANLVSQLSQYHY